MFMVMGLMMFVATVTCVIVMCMMFVTVSLVLMAMPVMMVMVTAAGVGLFGGAVHFGTGLPHPLQFHGHMGNAVLLQLPADGTL